MGITIASYNIHRCYGLDGHFDPERIRSVLRHLDAQIIALQEVELLRDAPGLLEYFCEGTELTAITGLTMQRESGHYGNALLTSLPIRDVKKIDLSVSVREPRGAIHATLDDAGQPINVIATHLGLKAAERRYQIRRLLDELEKVNTTALNSTATVLLGDLNEWFVWSRPRRWLRNYFEPSTVPATYPAFFPIFALDRILVKPAKRVVELDVINNHLTRQASDHLPIVARFE